MKPILKWAGGKTQLIDEIEKRMPERYRRYVEPFVGGGALFFSREHTSSYISDTNEQLINMYTQVRDCPNELMELLDMHTRNHSTEYFYEVRDRFNERMFKEHDVEDAAMMIYLNKADFNGLYRVNSQGLFNAPDGKKTRVNLYDRENIIECARQLKKSKIRCQDFAKTCSYLRAGDFVFFDSPYYDTFDTYQKGGFTEKDHIRLAKLFDRLTEKGVYCLLTNSDTDFIKDLYDRYSIDVVKVKRMINCDGNKRTGKEIIVTNYTNTPDGTAMITK